MGVLEIAGAVFALVLLGLLAYALVKEGPGLAKEAWLRVRGH
jgi:hypothetical protein